MNKILILMLMGCILMMFSVVRADDTVVQTCANGAGTIVKGVVSGRQYCKSNQKMNWWNAISWCDAQRKSLFSLSDCQCDGAKNCNKRCPELLMGNDENPWIWTSNASGESYAYFVFFSTGEIFNDSFRRESAYNHYALCK